MQARQAPYAARPSESRGRLIAEEPAQGRSAFARDRDRVIHSSAFRRLKHKTQVFVYHEGDHFRTRLTHSIEVAQVARSIARALGLDEDLTEALALAHDLGHTPFGHAGERALNGLMDAYGGFDHNAQSLRIVTKLERHYADFDGLNLTWEALEGLVKHNGPLVSQEGNPIGRWREDRLPEAIIEYSALHDLALWSYPSAEAQVAAISDDIAYNAHDIDDGLRAGLFDIIDLGDVPLAGEALAEVLRKYARLEKSRLVHETVRRVISAMIQDVISETTRRVKESEPRSVEQIRGLGSPLVGFSSQMQEKNRVLQLFLSRRMYQHERVLEIMARAQRVMADLFNVYMEKPLLLPREWREDLDLKDVSRVARRVCDFIAGMTDRFAMEQHREFFDLEPLFH